MECVLVVMLVRISVNIYSSHTWQMVVSSPLCVCVHMLP